MNAIFRGNGQRITIYPTKRIPVGTVVALSENFVGITEWENPANQPTQITLYGVFDVEIAPGKSYAIGDMVTAPAITLSGTGTTAKVGLAVAPVTAEDTTARVILLGPQAPTSNA
ncbi:MAG: DUF2190 family protein [Thermoguttaceae bacterium]